MLKDRLSEIQKEQAFRACTQVEILVAMIYLQKARLEACATKDNCAKDCLGIVDANIKALIQCHDVLIQAYRSFYY